MPPVAKERGEQPAWLGAQRGTRVRRRGSGYGEGRRSNGPAGLAPRGEQGSAVQQPLRSTGQQRNARHLALVPLAAFGAEQRGADHLGPSGAGDVSAHRIIGSSAARKVSGSRPPPVRHSAVTAIGRPSAPASSRQPIASSQSSGRLPPSASTNAQAPGRPIGVTSVSDTGQRSRKGS